MEANLSESNAKSVDNGVKVRVSLEITRGFRDVLRQIAAKEGRSVTKQGGILLEKALTESVLQQEDLIS